MRIAAGPPILLSVHFSGFDIVTPNRPLLLIVTTRQQFEEEWPSLWRDIQKQRVLERANAPQGGPAAAAF
jgi:hypothetical protein